MPVEPDTQPIGVHGAQWLVGGRYEVIERIGSGGMADVFRAHDRLLDRDVALKVFRTPPAGGQDDNVVERRELELQALARMSHPNLVTLFDGSVDAAGPAYLVLELVPGADLATRLRDGALAEPEVRLIGAQVAEALGYVHARGLVHRDVKPANILLGEDLGPTGPVRARLSDFGIVRMIGAQRSTSAELTVGTASYIAPEQARGADVEPAADVYSLGLVLIEALTGTVCFDGPMHEAIVARLARPPAIPADLPVPWPDLLSAMTSLDPGGRPSATEVAESLRTASAPAAPADVQAIGPLRALFPADDSDEALPVASRHRTRWASSAFVALAGVALAAVLAGASYVLLGGTASDSSGTTPPGTAPSGSVSISAPHSHRSASVANLRKKLPAASLARHTPPPRGGPHAGGPTAQLSTSAVSRPSQTPSPTPTSSPSPTPSTSIVTTPTPPPTSSAPATGV